MRTLQCSIGVRIKDAAGLNLQTQQALDNVHRLSSSSVILTLFDAPTQPRPYMLTRTASLDDLPNEILLEIIRFVGEQTHIPRKYRVLYHLSLVNRRLRLFAFPLLERCVSFPSSRRFLRVVDYWERAKGDGGYKHESLVRYASYASLSVMV